MTAEVAAQLKIDTDIQTAQARLIEAVKAGHAVLAAEPGHTCPYCQPLSDLAAAEAARSAALQAKAGNP
jgi:hypothetical protein